MKRLILLAATILSAASLCAQGTKELVNNHWAFSLGDASSMMGDFSHGTEYFTHFAKAATSGHSKSPTDPAFDDSAWQIVSLPHDWVVDLPYSGEASHSHGYKCIGWKYPQNSVGWYRKHLQVPAEDKGKQVWIEFEGIFRDSEVFCNGFYLGHERSGYSSSFYDLTPYLDYGGDNVITVRCNASTEEGWYYEGAGIYRNVWLHKAGPVMLEPYSLNLNCEDPVNAPEFRFILADESLDPGKVSSQITFFDAEGNEVKSLDHRWSPWDPYLYDVRLKLFYDGRLSYEYACRYGVRDIVFDTVRGLLVNGEPFKVKGANMHLDHAGVGVGVPDGLWRYRILQLKEYGFNTIRSSHNPASPAMLDLCDELGILVIDENREIGVNREQWSQLKNMIDRDRNHPCVFLWSIGNEEWAVEGNARGLEIARRMNGFVHDLDPTRPSTYGCSGGHELVKGVDVFGYNYIVQNPVDEYHERFPDHSAVGTEETSGAGTRGKYETVPVEGWMTPLNRVDTLGRINVIEHGWKFYKERPWTLGIIYWTGQDYRGEPNPMVWPATGSQFGILDYCCFPKDEAFYLKSVWTDEPTVHICGPCRGEVWVYSNCEKVTLYADGKSLGRKTMPKDGHLVWKAGGKVSRYTAKGYISGRTVASDGYPSTPSATTVKLSKPSFRPDGQDIVVLDIDSPEETLDVSVEGACFLGWGNGNPGFKETERPEDGRNSLTIKPFSNKAQVIVRSLEGTKKPATVTVAGQRITIGIL